MIGKLFETVTRLPEADEAFLRFQTETGQTAYKVTTHDRVRDLVWELGGTDWVPSDAEPERQGRQTATGWSMMWQPVDVLLRRHAMVLQPNGLWSWPEAVEEVHLETLYLPVSGQPLPLQGQVATCQRFHDRQVRTHLATGETYEGPCH